MIEINNAVAALEDLNKAVAEYDAIGTSKMFAGMSFALEEAAVDTKQEAKQGLWAKLKAFIARVVEWFKKKFAGKKQEKTDLQKELQTSQEKVEKDFDAFMENLKNSFAASENEAKSATDDALNKARNTSAQSQQARQAPPENFDDLVIKAVIDSGLVQERAKAVIAEYSAMNLLLGITGKVDPEATARTVDALAGKLVPFCGDMERTMGLKGQELADKFIALSEASKPLAQEAKTLWGKEAFEKAKSVCQSAPAEALLKAIGSIDNMAGRHHVITECSARIQKVFDSLSSLDLSEDLSDEVGTKIYSQGGAQELINGLVIHVSWINNFAAYGLDTKLQYIKLFNSSKVGEEKRAQVAKGLVDKFKITPDKANEAVAFAMGIAHLRLMNAQ